MPIEIRPSSHFFRGLANALILSVPFWLALCFGIWWFY
jgi:hypothetical protein